MPDEANDETTHLSESELRDLVVVCLPAHDTEAYYLISCLEEAGIPAAQIADTMRYPGTVPDIRVPRALLGKAKEVVDNARADAKSRALDDAFSTEDVDAKDLAKDEVLVDMAKLVSLPMSEKRGELLLRTIDWFSTGRSDVEIARYLAVAGLTEEETHDLVREIQTQHQARFKIVQKQYRHMGFALVGFAALLFIMALSKAVTHQLVYSGAFLALFLGLAVLYGASKKPQESALGKEADESTK